MGVSPATVERHWEGRAPARPRTRRTSSLPISAHICVMSSTHYTSFPRRGRSLACRVWLAPPLEANTVARDYNPPIPHKTSRHVIPAHAGISKIGHRPANRWVKTHPTRLPERSEGSTAHTGASPGRSRSFDFAQDDTGCCLNSSASPPSVCNRSFIPGGVGILPAMPSRVGVSPAVLSGVGGSPSMSS